jgi:hypothetical protein
VLDGMLVARFHQAKSPFDVKSSFPGFVKSLCPLPICSEKILESACFTPLGGS